MKRLKRSLLFLFLLAAACIACSFAAVLIDTPRMRENAAESCALLCEEGATPELAGGFKSSQADNFTAVLILKTAAYTGGETLLQRAFGGFRTELPAGEGEDAWEAFCTYADGRTSPTGGLSYSRYWHGYILPLRILLCFFNYSNIRMLLYALQTALFALVLVLADRRGLYPLVPGFIAAFLLTMPAVTGLCIQFAPVSLLSLGGSAFLLAAGGKPGPSFRPILFAALGILTAWLDLLTAPTLTLSLPLVFTLALALRERSAPSGMLRLALGCCIGWGLGYAGMWAFKWVLNGLVFGPGYAAGVFSQITLRLSGKSGGVSFSRLEAFRRNAYLLFGKPAYLALLAAAALCSLAFSLRRPRRVDLRALALLIPGAAALLWMLVTPNHIWDHSYYTYRNLCGFIFSLLACLGCAAGNDYHAQR
ncbi:MAG: hypothetical protein IJ573_07245 [Clostridia bacterium]|nr:hypothetical protein [Clostridia bacterium]